MGCLQSLFKRRPNTSDLKQFYKFIAQFQTKQSLHLTNDEPSSQFIESFPMLSVQIQYKTLKYLFKNNHFVSIQRIRAKMQQMNIEKEKGQIQGQCVERCVNNRDGNVGRYEDKEYDNWWKLIHQYETNDFKKLEIQLDLLLLLQPLKEHIVVPTKKHKDKTSLSPPSSPLNMTISQQTMKSIKLSLMAKCKDQLKKIEKSIPQLHYQRCRSYIDNLQYPYKLKIRIDEIKQELRKQFKEFDRNGKKYTCLYTISKKWLSSCRKYVQNNGNDNNDNNDKTQSIPSTITHLDIAFVNILDNNWPFLDLYKHVELERINERLWLTLNKYFNGVDITYQHLSHNLLLEIQLGGIEAEELEVSSTQNDVKGQYIEVKARFKDIGENSSDMAAVSQRRLQAEGLKNIGNTCYMNSVLQCLKNSTYFTSQLKRYIKQINSTDKLIKHLSSFFNHCEKYNEIYQPYDIQNQIATYDPSFKIGDQHDSGTLLSVILDMIATSTNNNNNNNNKMYNELSEPILPSIILNLNKEAEYQQYLKYLQKLKKRQETILNNILNNTFKTIYRCNNCNNKIQKFQKNTILYLPIPNKPKPAYFHGYGYNHNNYSNQKATLKKCIDEYEKSQPLRWKCNICNIQTRHEKNLQIYTVNKIIIFCLKRFDQKGNKIDDAIEIPLSFTIQQERIKIEKVVVEKPKEAINEPSIQKQNVGKDQQKIKEEYQQKILLKTKIKDDGNKKNNGVKQPQLQNQNGNKHKNENENEGEGDRNNNVSNHRQKTITNVQNKVNETNKINPQAKHDDIAESDDINNSGRPLVTGKLNINLDLNFANNKQKGGQVVKKGEQQVQDIVNSNQRKENLSKDDKKDSAKEEEKRQQIRQSNKTNEKYLQKSIEKPDEKPQIKAQPNKTIPQKHLKSIIDKKSQKILKIYSLTSFINHQGNRRSGHYTCCCKSQRFNNNWVTYNDSRVNIESKLPLNKLQTAYILFYSLVE